MNRPQYESVTCSRCGGHCFWIVVNGETSPDFDTKLETICNLCISDETELFYFLGICRTEFPLQEYLGKEAYDAAANRQQQSLNVSAHLRYIEVARNKKEQTETVDSLRSIFTS
jgi:hypothetical protein